MDVLTSVNIKLKQTAFRCYDYHHVVTSLSGTRSCKVESFYAFSTERAELNAPEQKNTFFMSVS